MKDWARIVSGLPVTHKTYCIEGVQKGLTIRSHTNAGFSGHGAGFRV